MAFEIKKVPYAELEQRMVRFRAKMDADKTDWETAFIISKVNQYYFTGTMQDGMLVIPRDGEATYWVRQSYERAVAESLFPDIRPMSRYKDAASFYQKHGGFPVKVHLEAEFVTEGMLGRLKKHFVFGQTYPLDRQILEVRSVKSAYELDILIRAGKIHRKLFEEELPLLAVEGMSEVDYGLKIYTAMVKNGHQGISRFGMTDTEMIVGQIGFGISSLYPGYFNGPGGGYGMSPAVPLLGNRETKLAEGDLVFVDAAFGLDGYHTDKTVVFVYKGKMSHEAAEAHKKCIAVQDEIAAMLLPGMPPSDIYKNITGILEPSFMVNFMGFGRRSVKFLGHGTGLLVDEYPVIAEGFDEPLEENMVIAVEPKKGIEGAGMVGIENTFIVTPCGGVKIT